MGGSGYNPSLAAGRSARGKATTRTPVHFYLDVPLYAYSLPCVDAWGEPHLFHSRTPLAFGGTLNGEYVVWCERCREYRWLNALTLDVNRPHSADEPVSIKQDEGIVAERAAMWLARNRHLDDDSRIVEARIRFGLSLSKLRQIDIGIDTPPTAADSPDTCRAGKHLMTTDNTLVVDNGRQKVRRCRACENQAQRDKRARRRRASQ